MGGIKMRAKKVFFCRLIFNFSEKPKEGEGQGTDGGEQGADGNIGGQEKGTPEEKPENDTSRIDKLIEEAVKRQTKKMSDENRRLAKTLEKLQKEKLSEDELKQLKIDNKMAEIAEREKQITKQENGLYAIKAIKAVGLDDGSENSLELIDFVMCDTKEEIDNRAKTFSALVNKLVKADVDRKFKESGRVPGRSSTSGGGGDNIAVMLGKMTAQSNEKSRSIIDSYINK